MTFVLSTVERREGSIAKLVKRAKRKTKKAYKKSKRKVTNIGGKLAKNTWIKKSLFM